MNSARRGYLNVSSWISCSAALCARATFDRRANVVHSRAYPAVPSTVLTPVISLIIAFVSVRREWMYSTSARMRVIECDVSVAAASDEPRNTFACAIWMTSVRGVCTTVLRYGR